jgi:PIN domain nuclease of toxin-antitoxin system
VRLLLDTHILLWAGLSRQRLPESARVLLEDGGNTLLFSAVSIWEVAIKRSLGRDDFRVDPRLLRRGLTDNGYEELPLLGQHVVAIDVLPTHHRDPFDRILIAQALVEGITLLTVDPVLGRYAGPIRVV